MGKPISPTRRVPAGDDQRNIVQLLQARARQAVRAMTVIEGLVSSEAAFAVEMFRLSEFASKTRGMLSAPDHDTLFGRCDAVSAASAKLSESLKCGAAAADPLLGVGKALGAAVTGGGDLRAYCRGDDAAAAALARLAELRRSNFVFDGAVGRLEPELGHSLADALGRPSRRLGELARSARSLVGACPTDDVERHALLQNTARAVAAVAERGQSVVRPSPRQAAAPAARPAAPATAPLAASAQATQAPTPRRRLSARRPQLSLRNVVLWSPRTQRVAAS